MFQDQSVVLFHNLVSMVRSVLSHLVFFHLKEKRIEVKKWPDWWLPCTSTEPFTPKIKLQFFPIFNYKQLLDEVFVISRIIEVEVEGVS